MAVAVAAVAVACSSANPTLKLRMVKAVAVAVGSMLKQLYQLDYLITQLLGSKLLIRFCVDLSGDVDRNTYIKARITQWIFHM